MPRAVALDALFGVIAVATVAHAQPPAGARITLGPVAGGHTYSIVSTAPGVTTGYLAIFDQTTNQFRLVIDPAGNVGIGTTNADRAKLFVVDTSVGTAVGGSTITTGSGVYGENTSNSGGGFGVYGTSTHGFGVYGTSSAFLYAGVYGISGPTFAGYGVYGKATGPGGVGVQAESTQGFALAALGNVYQARDKGGFVKALLYVSYDGTISRCYNALTGASLTGGGATTGCGFSVDHYAAGNYDIDFGFTVFDRFVSVTPRIIGCTGCRAGVQVGDFGPAYPSEVRVETYNAQDASDTDTSFIVVVY